mgnify:CR=1 FL=1
MPIYAYKCNACGRAQEHILPMAQRDDPGPCEDCGKQALVKQISSPSFRFERSIGWDGWDRVGPGTIGRTVPVEKHIDDPVSQRNPGSRKAP